MLKKIYNCDACGKEIKEQDVPEFKLPLKAHDDEGVWLRPLAVNLCRYCANRISRTYYEIAHEHGSSGVHGIVVGYEDEGDGDDD